MNPELHLFVLWEKSLVARDAILEKIKQRSEICRIFEITWSEARFAENLSRFYGEKLPPDCDKIGVCGKGSFLLVVVRDIKPEYATRVTTKGESVVNVNLFDLKLEVRRADDSGHHIHCTTDCGETDHDLMLLLGVDAATFDKENQDSWDGSIERLQQDVVGADGWASLKELFYVLNHTVEYVVLRNYENLPDQHVTDEHGDIDLLADNLFNLKSIANGTSVFDGEHRVHFNVNIDGNNVPFDFRYVGDGYYDFSWQRTMLDNRELSGKGFYTPCHEDHSYGILYHALVHKKSLSADYESRLSDLFASIEGVDLEFSDTQSLRCCLFKYMATKCYGFVRPVDRSVIYNKANVIKLTGILPADKQSCGSEIVGRVSDIIDSSDDLSTLSLDIAVRSAGADVGSTLSSEQVNILRPFSSVIKGKVLEIGARFGVVSRYLGETGAEVVAIEGNSMCRQIAENRNRDLSNVTIISEPMNQFDSDDRFDIITLLDGFNSAALFCEDSEPVEALMKKIRSLLAPNGVFILAIDNQLGVERLINGDAQASFSAIGKNTLTRMLSGAGYQNIDYLFPLPNHRDTKCILSPVALEYDNFDVEAFYDLGISSTKNTNNLNRSIKNIWSGVVQNGLSSELMGSFLVAVSDADTVHSLISNQLVSHYSVERRKAFCKASVFDISDEGRVTVNSVNLGGGATTKHADYLFNMEKTVDYTFGSPLINKLTDLMSMSGWSVQDIGGFVCRYIETLKILLENDGESVPLTRVEDRLPGAYVDAVPTNIIIDTENQPVLIDKEWGMKHGIEFGYLLYRALFESLAKMGCVAEPADRDMLNHKNLIQSVVSICDFEISDDKYMEYIEAENNFQCWVTGQPEASVGQVLGMKLEVFCDDVDSRLSELDAQLRDAERIIAEKESHIHSMYASRSWRITRPLRYIFGLLTIVKKKIWR